MVVRPGEKKPAPKPAPREVSADSAASWALPKNQDGGAATPTPDQSEMEFARELQGQRDQANEPTAEQLVALLSRMSSRVREPRVEVTPQTPYKARPISFDASRWDVVKLYISAHRVRLGFAGVGLVFAVAVLYLFKLVALNTEIDRQWLEVDHALRQRYAAVPQYVDCILAYSDNERFTLASTEKGLDAWRTAKTEQDVAAAAARMERILILLAKVMRRCEKGVPAPEPNQVDSSALFVELEQQRQQSRLVTTELVLRYNTVVENFNDKVQSAPGSWSAGLAGLHPRHPLFSSGG